MSELKANLNEVINKVLEYKEVVSGETNTRRVLIDPILNCLGYDTSNPYEVLNEYTCDFGVKKGEKVDYALFKDAELTILVEAKSIEVELDLTHISQLYRYFSVTNAQIGILTNGIEYLFFTDTKDKNKMDDKPFYSLNIEKMYQDDLDKILLFNKKDYNLDVIKGIFNNIALKESVEEYLINQTTSVDLGLSDYIQDKLAIECNKDDFAKVLQHGFKSLVDVSNVKVKNKLELVRDVVQQTDNITSGGELYLLKGMTSMLCTGTKIAKLIIEGIEYEVKSWSDAIFTLVNHIAVLNTKGVDWLDSLDGSLSENKGFIRKNPTKFLKCSAIGTTGLYLDTHGSSYMHIQRMKVICKNANLDMGKIQMELIN